MQVESFKDNLLKKSLLKSRKKINFIFLLNPSPFNKRDYEKQ